MVLEWCLKMGWFMGPETEMIERIDPKWQSNVPRWFQCPVTKKGGFPWGKSSTEKSPPCHVWLLQENIIPRSSGVMRIPWDSFFKKMSGDITNTSWTLDSNRNHENQPLKCRAILGSMPLRFLSLQWLYAGRPLSSSMGAGIATNGGIEEWNIRIDQTLMVV